MSNTEKKLTINKLNTISHFFDKHLVYYQTTKCIKEKHCADLDILIIP